MHVNHNRSTLVHHNLLVIFKIIESYVIFLSKVTSLNIVLCYVYG